MSVNPVNANLAAGILRGDLAFASEWLTIAADMPFFNNTPDDWQRLDWQILRAGGIHLYWRLEYLIEDTKWFADHDYDVFELACQTWKSRDDMFSDFASVLRLPDYFGRNLDALDECIADLPLTENRGAVIVLTRFDAYAAGAGSAPMERVKNEAEVVLDIIASASRFHLLNGNRLFALVQTDDPQLRFGVLGGKSPQWNRREWLDSNRRSNPS
jgi:hypothetical protein